MLPHISILAVSGRYLPEWSPTKIMYARTWTTIKQGSDGAHTNFNSNVAEGSFFVYGSRF